MNLLNKKDTLYIEDQLYGENRDLL